MAEDPFGWRAIRAACNAPSADRSSRRMALHSASLALDAGQAPSSEGSAPITRTAANRHQRGQAGALAVPVWDCKAKHCAQGPYNPLIHSALRDPVVPSGRGSNYMGLHTQGYGGTAKIC